MSLLNSPDDRDLIFGALALQKGLIDPQQFLSAMRERVLSVATPLSRILETKGTLSRSQRELLESIVADQLRDLEGKGRKVSSSLGVDELMFDIAAWVHGDESAMLEAIEHLRMATTVGQGEATTLEAEEAAELRKNGDGQPCSFTIERGEAPPAEAPRSSRSRYKIVGPHAKGGIGQVYEARDSELGRVVALKVLQPKHASNEMYQSRFIIEAEINGNLEHPGIVPVYGYGKDEAGDPFYAMRMVKGKTLREAIESYHRDRPGLAPTERSLRLRRLLDRFVVICEAMAYAHSRGVLHRDLKPSNVMLGRYGETQIIDWGLAKATGRPDMAASRDEEDPEATLLPSSGSSIEQTRDGSAIGTPEYMSPEAASGNSATLGVSADVFGLGAILYSILTGRSPNRGRDGLSSLEVARLGKAPAPSALIDDLPRHLDAICRKSMAFRPEARYESALELADDVRRWMADEPVAAMPDRFADRLARWERRNRTFVRIGSAASVLIALVSLGSLLLISRARDEAERNAALAQAAIGEFVKARDEAEERRVEAHQRLETIQRLYDEYIAPMVDDLAPVPNSADARNELADMLIEHYRAKGERFIGDKGGQRIVPTAILKAANIKRMLALDDEAEALYAEGLDLAGEIDDPMPAVALLIDRADWHRMNDRVEDAMADIEAARDRIGRIGDPNESLTYQGLLFLNRSAIDLDMGRFDDAIADADSAIERFKRRSEQPRSSYLIELLLVMSELMRVETLRELGKLRDAFDQAKETMARAQGLHNARALDPNVNLVYGTAIREYCRLLVTDPENHEGLPARINTALVAHASLFNEQRKMASIRHALIEGHLDRAECWILMGESGKARADARAAIDLIVGSPRNVRARGSVHRTLGRANSILARVADSEGDPKDERAKLRLALAAHQAALEKGPHRELDRRDAERIRLRLAELDETQPDRAAEG